MSGPFSRPGIVLVLSLALCLAAPARSASVPAKNPDPDSATIRLDSSFQSDAWLVYTYDIDVDGSVVNASIKYSNGVLEVEQAVLQQLGAMRFQPATNNSSPVKASAGPVTYTWILDKARELSPRFGELYREAWAYYAQENYAAAQNIAEQLKNYPGRNAKEEVKYRILAASLASRRPDNAAELRHLKRVVQFQDLALDNNFSNTYVPAEQYLKVLKRIMELQLGGYMLADAEDTLGEIQSLGGGSALAADATNRWRQAEQAFRSLDDLPVQGELVGLYPGGPGSWKTGLSRRRFAISDVQGRAGGVWLACSREEKQLRYPAPEGWTIPPGWTRCLIEVSGDAGTRLVLHQYASGP
jgi:hypothetical protein